MGRRACFVGMMKDALETNKRRDTCLSYLCSGYILKLLHHNAF